MLDTLKRLFQSDSQPNLWQVHRCFSCNRTIQEGFVFPEDQVSFCPKCFHSTACYSCGLPCGPVHRRLSDDRIICQHCYSTALLTPRQLLPVYESTIKFLQSKLKMKLKGKPRLKVVDTRFMQKEFDCSPYTWGVYTNRGKEETVYIISGIALDKAHTTLAHELTHYWQKQACPPGQSLELMEGFAEWVSFQLAKHKGMRRAMLALRRNEAEPYRSGLQKMFQLESKKGVKGAVQFVQKGKSL